ncbi:hypothetical protein [Sphingomicrobium astaxanthinifaciens]|uniref:hypothetical protein n=1 Tax=Sphingomicrobium astaxanthinifaciens TaxID=1227949 RepID=UPI001FCC4676|nr:hypothetical protein [Sphingomicrobium astaxanthinifaciens]MCJ7420411.1 hypothetical protein [Sphingomicrobium astaxanthinifaciens]
MSETFQFGLKFVLWAKDAGIPFAVVRGLEDEHAPPGDVDLITTDPKLLRKAIKKFCKQNNASVIRPVRRHYVEIYRIVFKSKSGALCCAKFDVHNGEQWRGATYLKAEEAVQQSNVVDRIPRLNPRHALIANIFQASLAGLPMKESRIARIQNRLEQITVEDRVRLKQEISSLIGVDVQSSIENIGHIGSLVKTRRTAFWFISLKGMPMATIYNISVTIYRKIKNFIFPPGIYISIIGPDGAGKSTLVKALSEKMGVFCAGEHFIVQHWRPGVLRPLATFRRGVGSPDGVSSRGSEVQSASGVTKARQISSLIRFIYYLGDYLVGYWFRTRPALVAEGVVICDRYVDDFVIAPANRSNVFLPKTWKSVLAIIVPQPPIRFYLRGEPSLLHARKSEETLEELQYLVCAYDRHSAESDIEILDATKKPQNIVSQVLTRVSGGNRWAE